jgi:hypothetical protein
MGGRRDRTCRSGELVWQISNGGVAKEMGTSQTTQIKCVASVRVVSTRRHHTSPSRMVGSTVCRLILRPLSVVERDSADGGVAMAAPAARAELENGRKKCPDNWSGGLS